MTVRRQLDLTDALTTINRYYPATAEPPRTTTSQTRLAHASKTPIPATVISTRRDTIDTLTAWAQLVADERDLHPAIATGDVPALTRFLTDHAPWLAVHSAGPTAARELGHCARQLEQIVKQSRPARVDVGTCPEQECDGRLVATVRRGEDLLPSAVRCDQAPRDHVWEPHDWPALGRRINRHLNPQATTRLTTAITT